MIRAIDRFDCGGSHTRCDSWYRVAVGDALEAPEGAQLSRCSHAGTYLTGLFDGVKARYVRRRLHELGAITIHARWREHESRRTYELTLDGRHIVVRRGRKLLAEATVDDDELIQLVDGVLAHTFDESGDFLYEAHAELAVGDSYVRFVLGRRDYSRAEFLTAAFNAAYRAEHPL